MARRPRLTAQQWIAQVFSAQAVGNGGIVRRKIASVNQYASHQDLEDEVRRRHFHMVITGDQYVIMCNTGHWQVIC